MAIAFVELILFHGLTHPHKPAMILPDRVVTFGMLRQGILSAAERIAAAGLASGQLAAIVIDSPTKHLALACALFHSGIASMSLSNAAVAEAVGVKIDAVLQDGNIAFAPGLKQIFVGDDWLAPGAQNRSVPRPARTFGDDDVCRVTLTSGTTGRPKPVGRTLRSHSLIKLHLNLIMLEGGAFNRMLCLSPPTAQWGFTKLILALSARKTLVFATSPLEALQKIAVYDVDCLIASTQHLREMLEQHKSQPFPMHSLRFVYTSGSAMSAALLQELRARFCSNIIRSYGSTEVGPVAFASGDALAGFDGFCGHVMPWVQVEAVGPDGRPLRAGEEGEIRVRSPLQGRPFGTAADRDDSFNDGWFHPGDIGKVMPDGTLVITGRATELINAGGAKVAPDLVEEMVREQRGVADVAAFAGAGSLGAVELWVAVVAREGFDPQRVRTYCGARGLVIDRVIAIDAIPRTPSGKIARETLRSMLGAMP
jgi:acyl-coenzyme A synthetase/AMP-(fatty) acid ligase